MIKEGTGEVRVPRLSKDDNDQDLRRHKDKKQPRGLGRNIYLEGT